MNLNEKYVDSNEKSHRFENQNNEFEQRIYGSALKSSNLNAKKMNSNEKFANLAGKSYSIT